MTNLDAQERYLNLLVESGQQVVRGTMLFGKPYVWMRDPVGNTLYLERLPDPVNDTVSVNGQTGEVTPIV